ncbi:beta-lactamase [Flavobacteriales bacterium ALC-1]|nr:beta-lactamase [Flavobacteriales bacterium ALC-1]
MKIIYILPILIILFSCNGKKAHSDKKEAKATEREIIIPEFQTIIDSANVDGAILIYDFEGKKYYSNNFEWTRKGKLPASTFKIINSIIALEIRVVENDSTLFKWDGEKRRIKNWEQDLIFRDAFHFSCVPCYQEIARKIGAKKMTKYIDKLEYGNMKVDSSNIDLFWLEGESRISQFQQIDFLKRFYLSKLKISKRTETIMKRMMIMEKSGNYKLSGKTGWSIRNGNNNGWFVGYIENENKTYFFATNVEPKEQFDMKMFPLIRKDVTFKAFEQMKIIK